MTFTIKMMVLRLRVVSIMIQSKCFSKFKNLFYPPKNLLIKPKRNSTIDDKVYSNKRTKTRKSQLIIPNFDEIIRNNYASEMKCLFDRLNCKFVDDEKSLNLFKQEINSDMSFTGYFTVKTLVTHLVYLHYNKILPAYLLNHFSQFLVHRDMITKISDYLGISDLLRVLLNSDDNAASFTYPETTSSIDIDDYKCSSFYAFISYVEAEISREKASNLLDTILIPQLESFNWDIIADGVLTEILKLLLFNLKMSQSKLLQDQNLNQRLINEPNAFRIVILSGEKMLAEATHPLRYKAITMAKIQAICELLNSNYIHDINTIKG